MTISAGFMGKVTVNGNATYVNSCSIAKKQGIQIPDAVMNTYKHVVYGADKIEISGGCSGPVTDGFTSIWDSALLRPGCGTPAEIPLNVDLGCTLGSTDYCVMINSATMSCTAGDVAQFSFEVIGRKPGVSCGATGGGSFSAGGGRIVTWDSIQITGAPGSDIASVEMTINNACVPIYKISDGSYTGSLWPDEILGGIQTITGSIGIYGAPGTGDGWEDQASFAIGTGTIVFGTFGTITGVTYHRPIPNLGVGPVIITYPFTCVFDP